MFSFYASAAYKARQTKVAIRRDGVGSAGAEASLRLRKRGKSFGRRAVQRVELFVISAKESAAKLGLASPAGRAAIPNLRP